MHYAISSVIFLLALLTRGSECAQADTFPADAVEAFRLIQNEDANFPSLKMISEFVYYTGHPISDAGASTQVVFHSWSSDIQILIAGDMLNGSEYFLFNLLRTFMVNSVPSLSARSEERIILFSLSPYLDEQGREDAIAATKRSLGNTQLPIDSYVNAFSPDQICSASTITDANIVRGAIIIYNPESDPFTLLDCATVAAYQVFGLNTRNLPTEDGYSDLRRAFDLYARIAIDFSHYLGKQNLRGELWSKQEVLVHLSRLFDGAQ